MRMEAYGEAGTTVYATQDNTPLDQRSKLAESATSVISILHHTFSESFRRGLSNDGLFGNDPLLGVE